MTKVNVWEKFRRVPSKQWLGLGFVCSIVTLSGYLMVYRGSLYRLQRDRIYATVPDIEAETRLKIRSLATPSPPPTESTTTTNTTATTTTTTTTTTKTTTTTTTKTTTTTVLERPKIAFWAKQYHEIDWTFPQLKNGDGGCDISFDRKDVPNADAVLFFMKSCKPRDLPPAQSRRKNQVYVWFSQESPWTTRHYYGHQLTEYDNYFNWTMTYRTDSDVIAAMWPTPAMDYLLYRVGRTEEMLDTNLVSNPTLDLKDFEKQVQTLLKKKTDLIAWIVSDCSFTKGASKRLQKVKTLEDTGIRLSKFGKCVGKILPYNFTVIYNTLSPFKFYLAFENTVHCQDYLTEKTLYNCFVTGTVPVIHGPTKKDVERLLPKGSYIFVEDFDDMNKLKDYLHYLDQNDSAYMEYFKWWMDPGAQIFPRFGFNFGPSYVPRSIAFPQFNTSDLQDDWMEFERFGLYHLCRKLKLGHHVKQTRIIPSLADWWYGTQPIECAL